MIINNWLLQNLNKTAYVEHLAHNPDVIFLLLEINGIMKDFEC